MAPSQRAATPVLGGQPAPLAYAGLQLRVVAFILDVLVLISIFMLFVAAILALLLIDSSNSNPSDRAFLISAGILALYIFAFVPLYHLLLWTWRGQTVGMMAVRIKLLSRTGGRVSLGRAALRLFVYPASVVPLLMGIAIALIDRENRTLHDQLAGTVVVELP
ncbi:MAG: RDD family protein [Chloroflexi bacterium]|nr:RDD family protein [Chloroflexota bacterium]